nr:MAG: hypothetical protein [Caudoviricetes sp.]
MKENSRSPLFKVKSIINSDIYFSSEDFPKKIIDDKVFIGVKKSPSDKTLHYMLKDNIKKVVE